MASEASAMLLAGASSGDLMTDALTRIAALGAGDGAVLVRSRADVTIGMAPSASVVDPVAAYVRGDRPADPRVARVRPGLDSGFRLDQDDFAPDEIARDPYYQEFLRPIGFGWHACALLGVLPGGDEVHLSIKRRFDRPPFSPAELAELTTQLPSLRAAVAFANLTLPGHLLGGVGPVLAGGRSVFGLTAGREAFPIERTPDDAHVLALEDGAIRLRLRREQPAFDAALNRALALAESTAVVLTAARGGRWLARFIPVSRFAPSSLVCLCVLTELDVVVEPAPERIELLGRLFALSPAEARVATLIGQGLSIAKVALRLGVSDGTVRNHLKAIFDKTGVGRQVGLAVLLARI
ncbi:MAG: helix-turn-helix transcriptional regulator [Methylobacteriaceae bacterium]|nr:helix-turn-helix transcriptional regulator [Methylobacteriaceae bacterium]